MLEDDYKIDAPDVDGAFERARKPRKKERVAAAKLELNPPAPAPAGLGAQEAKPLVSPYLRDAMDPDRDARIRQHLASMLAKREFNRSVRNTQER